MIQIGNIYGHGFEERDVAELERLGFAIRPGVDHFAGTQVMRFIDFSLGPALELIHVTDAKAYADFVPDGMVPFCPGINLLLTPESGTSLEDYAHTFSAHRPRRLHVNYDGSPDAGKPGWNYLNFGVPLVRDTFIWLTMLDEPKPARPTKADHPNGVLRIRGLWLNVKTEELQPLARLVGGTVHEGALGVGAVTLWSKDGLRDVPVPRGKQFPLQTIVLDARDAHGFDAMGPKTEPTTFQSRAAVRIRTNLLSWDLLIVESQHQPRVHSGVEWTSIRHR